MESSAAALRKMIRKGFPEVVTNMLRMRRNQPCKALREGESWLREQQVQRACGRSGFVMIGLYPCGWSVEDWGRGGFSEVAKGFLNIFSVCLWMLSTTSSGDPSLSAHYSCL